MYLLVNREKFTPKNVVVKMASIHNYTVLDDLGNYDKELNPNRLSTIELLPKGVSWLHNGKKIEIKDDNKIAPVLLLNGDEVALIKSPYDKDQNKAYIIDAEGNIKGDVKDIINKKASDAIFYNVDYIYDELFFFLNIRNCDYRFSFNTKTVLCGNLLQTY